MNIGKFMRLSSKARKEREKNYVMAQRTKSKALCNACKHDHYCSNQYNGCRACEQYGGEYHCKCSDVENGEKCEYFKPIESEGCK